MRVVARILAWCVLCGTAGASLNGSWPAQPAGLDGYWLSEGYGYFAEIKGSRLELFEITSISCLSRETYTRSAETGQPGGVRFSSSQGADPIVLSSGSSPDSQWLQQPGAASKILFHRSPDPPAPCSRPTPNDPETNFEIVWQTFASHHGFLTHRGTDWSAMYERYRPKVTPQTSPSELFDILAAMIEPLHDAHTSLRAPALARTFHGRKPGTLVLSDSQKQDTISILESRYVVGKLRYWCRGHLGYARLRQGAGYMRIDAFADYSETGGFDNGGRALSAALDDIMQDAQQLTGLVIDVRVNAGGDDPYGVQIAGRLSDRPYVAFVKRARNDAKNPESWTAPQVSTVRVSDGPRFRGEIVELIGPDTVSAGETFTMALMGREPHVARIGENTQGVYSDVLGRHLPNGWRFGLPNEVFLTADGKHFEARGVPPDIRVPVFSKEDLAQRRDAALEKALALLTSGPSRQR